MRFIDELHRIRKEQAQLQKRLNEIRQNDDAELQEACQKMLDAELLLKRAVYRHAYGAGH